MALVALVDVSDHTRAVVSREVDLLRDAAAFDALIYQKGFVADYMLTGDSVWLEKLEATRAEFARWVTRSEPWLDGQQHALLAEIIRENNAYDALRRRAIDLFDAGRNDEAVAMIPLYHRHIDALFELAQRFSAVARSQTQSSLISAERSIRELAWLLVVTSVISALASLIVGYLWARRVARPLYQLQLQVESAAQRTRIHVEASGDDRGLAAQIAALVHKAEEADAELTQQRRRLVQSEKMSAIGELAAKLGHEILNPLAGMKAAVQLMSIQAESAELNAADLRSMSSALEREVTRIEQLVRRLLGYARPLTLEVSACEVSAFLEDARQSVEGQLREARWRFVRDVSENLPCIEVDRLLITQLFVNLLRNAVEAMPEGGTITTRASLRESLARREVVAIEILDEGPGLPPDVMARVFTPFHSTKPAGHGLGLATSRNIVVEHGGAIEAHNRGDRSGARFEVLLPVSR